MSDFFNDFVSNINLRLVDAQEQAIKDLKYHIKIGEKIIAEGVTTAEGKIQEFRTEMHDIVQVYVQRFNNDEMKLISEFNAFKQEVRLKIHSSKSLVEALLQNTDGDAGNYKEKTYAVKKGDTLASIAQAHSTSVSQIAILNNIKNINLLHVGEVLKIPAKQAPISTKAPPQKPEAPFASQERSAQDGKPMVAASGKGCTCQNYNLLWGAQVNCAFRKKAVEICAELWGESKAVEMANALMAVMYVESAGTFSPSKVELRKTEDGKRRVYRGLSSQEIMQLPENFDGAVGLIQFTNIAIEALNKNFKYKSKLTKRNLTLMTAVEQLDIVKDYFKLGSGNSKIKMPEEIYLHVFAPVGVGKPDDFVLYSEEKNKKNYAANSSVDRGGKGYITRSDILSRFKDSCAAGAQKKTIPDTSGCSKLGKTGEDSGMLQSISDWYSKTFSGDDHPAPTQTKPGPNNSKPVPATEPTPVQNKTNSNNSKPTPTNKSDNWGASIGNEISSIYSSIKSFFSPDSVRTPWMVFAEKEFQKKVKRHAGKTSDENIVGYFKATSHVAKNDKVPYCAAFVNWCIEQTGKYHGNHSARAVSLAKWGRPTRGNLPAYGAIMVIEFPTGGNHVTFVTGFKKGSKGKSIATLGGNQGAANEVSHSSVPASWAIAYRYPSDYPDHEEDYKIAEFNTDDSVMSKESTR